MENVWRDIIHATRRLRHAPGFTIAAVLTLGLAIGANATIFTMIHRVLLNPLPYPNSDRLIDLDHGAALINIPMGMGMKGGLYCYYLDLRWCGPKYTYQNAPRDGSYSSVVHAHVDNRQV